MKKRLIIQVMGRVQGVFFRDTALTKASELNLKGLVENSSDGSVLIIAEGEEKNLLDLLKWAKIGPEFAEIEKIDSHFAEATGEFKNFQVK